MRRGDLLPEIVLLDDEGVSGTILNHLSRFHQGSGGYYGLVYIFPEAETPGCTIQAESVRDSLDDLAELQVSVVGLSPDQPEVLAAFRAGHNLGHPLLSDPLGQAALALGAAESQPAAGQRPRLIRSALLFGKDHRLIEAWYGLRPEETTARVAFAIP
jgi:peroxiredoxin Q/BCP